MSQPLLISDLPLKGKKVLVRVDFNVPLEKGAITDDMRIRASLPTIRYILDQGGSAILMSHLGRPKDKVVPELSLAPCAKRLSELLGLPVQMAPDCVGPEVEKMAAALKPGEVLLLENLRFHRGEEHPNEDPAFVQGLSGLGDVYINDAFGTAHREHASTASIAAFFNGARAMGFLMEKEVKFLSEAFKNPKKPFYAIIGGAKISTKLGVLKALVNKVDALFIGGGMAYTFMKAMGIPIGNSIHEDDLLDEAKNILALYKEKGIPFHLPYDVVVAEAPTDEAIVKIAEPSAWIPQEYEGLDIGPKTIIFYKTQIQNAGTLFWNGPLGKFEVSRFAVGTFEIAKAVAALKAVTIVGGGDSIAALEAAGVVDKITHVSTGGGASLELIEFGTLPGLEALQESVPVRK